MQRLVAAQNGRINSLVERVCLTGNVHVCHKGSDGDTSVGYSQSITVTHSVRANPDCLENSWLHVSTNAFCNLELKKKKTSTTRFLFDLLCNSFAMVKTYQTDSSVPVQVSFGETTLGQGYKNGFCCVLNITSSGYRLLYIPLEFLVVGGRKSKAHFTFRSDIKQCLSERSVPWILAPILPFGFQEMFWIFIRAERNTKLHPAWSRLPGAVVLSRCSCS